MEFKQPILALDIGTTTGLAWFNENGILQWRGTLKFTPKYQAQEFFNALCELITPDIVVVWEEPFGKYGQTVLQRMVGAMLAACTVKAVVDCPIHLAKIKKFATGKGSASKERMIAAADAKWSDGDWNEHTADACWAGAAARALILTNEKVEGL